MLIIEENASISKVTTVIDKETLYDLLSYTETTVLPQYGGKLASIKKSTSPSKTRPVSLVSTPVLRSLIRD